MYPGFCFTILKKDFMCTTLYSLLILKELYEGSKKRNPMPIHHPNLHVGTRLTLLDGTKIKID